MSLLLISAVAVATFEAPSPAGRKATVTAIQYPEYRLRPEAGLTATQR